MEEKLFEKKLIGFIHQKPYIELSFKNTQDVNKFKEITSAHYFDRSPLYDYFLSNRISFITLNNFCTNLIDSYNYLKSIQSTNTISELNDAIDELYNRNDNFSLSILSWPDILWGYYKHFEPNNNLISLLGWDGISLISNESYKFGYSKYYFYNKETPYFDTVVNFKRINLSMNPADNDIETFLDSFKKEELFNHFSKFITKKSISKKDFIQDLVKNISINDFNKYDINIADYFKFLNYEHLYSLNEIKNHYYYYRHKIALADVLSFINNKYLEFDESLRMHFEWKENNFYYVRWTTNRV